MYDMKDLLHASAALCALSMVLCAGCAADKPGSESGAEKTGMESSVRQEILHGMAAYAPSVLEAAGEESFLSGTTEDKADVGAEVCHVLLSGSAAEEDAGGQDAEGPAGTGTVLTSPESGHPARQDPPDTGTVQTPEAADIVRIRDYIPDIQVDLKYATDDNFTGQVIYDFSDAWLRYGTVLKLEAAQKAAREHGMTLLCWDAFRPVSAQFRLWEAYPDSTYVANPNTGYSSHSRGNTVDITIVSSDGTAIEMPTGFDDFSSLADRDYSDCSQTAAGHARLLEQIMEEAGFKPYFGEWWHFSDTETYPVAAAPLEMG